MGHDLPAQQRSANFYRTYTIPTFRFGLRSSTSSCLGPLLFIIYASKLFKIIEDQLPDSHGYADDTQLYLSSKPSLSTSQEDGLCAMESCIEKIRCWMIQDKLLMNDGKTEFLVIGTRQQLCKLQPISISVNNSVISPSPHIKNLGSWLDSNLNMTTHFTKVCKACFFHLHNIRRIKKYLSRDNLLILVHAFITSRLDYCNSLFYGLPGKQISKLQRVQNAAARLVMDVPKYSHITPVLYELHWLPVHARIQFKVLLFAFKAIHDLAPSYIKDLINVKSKSSFNLRSITMALYWNLQQAGCLLPWVPDPFTRLHLIFGTVFHLLYVHLHILTCSRNQLKLIFLGTFLLSFYKIRILNFKNVNI